jgi:hypothetical protein
MKKGTWPGNWKVACHVCGIWYTSSEIRKRWDGVLVCPQDYEERHPQTLIRINSRSSVPEFISKDPDPTYVSAGQCSVSGNSGFAGFAVAGCAKSGNNTIPAAYLDITHNGHGGM